jgi:squalene-associated FAD-dependent desaturase
MNISNAHVAIIGGGCAGLSAAAALIEKGFQVTIFESSSQLGGRARTVLVENNSLMHLLDNGQHILLGAYRETLKLLRKVGVDEEKAFMRVPLQINMHAPTVKSIFSLKSANYLPSPLNMLVALITCKGLSISELIAAIKFMVHLRSTGFQITGDKALEPYLIEHKQPIKLIEMLWEPLCLAALNTPIAIASTKIFLNVLKDSFSNDSLATRKKNSDFLLPRLDLSKIIANPIAHYLQEHGTKIKLNRRIRHLELDDDGFSLTTRDGKALFSHVVIAAPVVRLDKLIESIPKLQNVYKQTQNYSYQPIYTIYLQYPPDFKLSNVMYGLSGTLGQWVFDRGQLCDQKGLLAVIVSATGKHQLLSQNELALRIAKELHQTFPNMPKPLWHKVIAEKRATFSCAPNLARPANKTPQPRLYLAGDYTYADYPATIEGAVRSGIACANLIANSVD